MILTSGIWEILTRPRKYKRVLPGDVKQIDDELEDYVYNQVLT